MRLACLIAIACACGGGPRVAAPDQRPLVSPDYTATRWIPAAPTYAVSARTIRDLQRAVVDVIDSFGIAFELEASELSRALVGLIRVDAMKPDALAAIGVDAEGGIAVFSEAISPTIVVRLSAPDQFAAFLDQQRARGMATTSEMVGSVELFTTKLGALWITWAVDGDWLWVHFGLPVDRKTDPSWFASSHSPAAPTWTEAWKRAARDSSKVAGFVDARALIHRLPRASNAHACTMLLAPVSHVSISARGDGKIATGRIAIEIGPAPAAVIRAATLPPPEGWDATARSAAVAAQWNVDVNVIAKAAVACLATFRFDLKVLEGLGVRTARAMVHSFDHDAKSGTGAFAFDLYNSRAFKELLDRIPLRSTLESDKTFGPWSGKSLSVPFGPTLEYVLTDQIALAGVGDDMLARAIGKGSGRAAPPVFALDVLPGGMSADAWRYGFSLIKLRRPERAAARLQRWREIHVTLILEGTHLVFEAAASRVKG